MTIHEAKEKHETALLRLPNVVGVGLGQKAGQDVITVLVTHKVPASQLLPQETIPPVLEGYATEVIAIGNPSIRS
ncbi:MAG: hypothetical protein U0Y68_08020 [Blastocatellia bacterium]